MADSTDSPAREALRGRLRIGDLTVDTGTHEVFRDGDRINLPRLSYQLLLALAECAPNMLTHDEIVDRVWPGRVISPETVTQRIRLLRQALDDDARDSRYIGLVRGEGYRLLTEVVTEPAPDPAGQPTTRVAATPSRTRQWSLAATAIALVSVLVTTLYLLDFGSPLRGGTPPAGNSVAVLRFGNASALADSVYLSDGMSRELGDLLRELPELQVSAPRSSLALQGRNLDLMTIAEQLGVRYLVTGTLLDAEDEIRLRVEIVDREAGGSIWQREFEQPRGELLELQEEIARTVAAELIPGFDPATAVLTPDTDSASAHDLLLLARHLEAQVKDQLVVDEALLLQVIELYRRAIDADPDSAIAHSRLANALLYLGDMEAAEVAVSQARALDPDSSEVQYTLGLYHWRRGESAGGAAFARAVELNPNNADALSELAKWYWHQARADLSGDLLRRALALDRMALTRYADLGNFYGLCKQREAALDIARQVLERFPDPSGMRVAARIFEVAGDLDEAIAWVTNALEIQPDEAEIGWQLAELYARIGDFDTAAQYETEPGAAQLFFARRYQQLLDFGTERLIDDPGDIKLYYLLAFAYNATGYHANAVRLLNLAGLPDSVFTEARRADAIEALATLADAHQQMGDLDQAHRYADWLADLMHQHIEVGVQIDWWPFLYGSCALEILGQRDLALERLAMVPQSIGLVWYPTLRDLGCFRSMADEPEYRAVVAAIDQRMADLRARLPATLQRHGLGSESAR